MIFHSFSTFDTCKRQQIKCWFHFNKTQGKDQITVIVCDYFSLNKKGYIEYWEMEDFTLSFSQQISFSETLFQTEFFFRNGLSKTKLWKLIGTIVKQHVI